MSIIGKRIAFMGDSITALYTWPANVGAQLEANITNMGLFGCLLGAHTGHPQSAILDNLSMYRIADNIATGNYASLTQAAQDWFVASGLDLRGVAASIAAQDWKNTDYIVLFYGTNDFAGTMVGGTGFVPLGTDTSATGATFKGALNYTINTIHRAYPNIKFVILSPLFRTGTYTTPNAASGLFLWQYTDAAKRIATIHSLPSFDMTRDAGINQANQATYLSDGVHPNAAGDLLIERIVTGFLGDIEQAVIPEENWPDLVVGQEYRLKPKNSGGQWVRIDAIDTDEDVVYASGIYPHIADLELPMERFYNALADTSEVY